MIAETIVEDVAQFRELRGFILLGRSESCNQHWADVRKGGKLTFVTRNFCRLVPEPLGSSKRSGGLKYCDSHRLVPILCLAKWSNELGK